MDNGLTFKFGNRSMYSDIKTNGTLLVLLSAHSLHVGIYILL